MSTKNNMMTIRLAISSTRVSIFSIFFRLIPAFIGVALVTQHLLATEYRATNVSQLQSYTTQLKAGDTLVVAPGTYTLGSWSINGLTGNSNQWITIKAEGKVIIQGTSTGSNVVSLRNSRYLNFIGFEITSTTSPDAGIDGIKFESNAPSSYINFENLYIHHVSGNGICIMADGCSFVTVRNSEISYATTCGIYWGFAKKYIVHDVLVANNYIHHCPPDSSSSTGYGIQFKGESYRGRFINNVLHDVGGSSRSGLIVYYGRTYEQGDNPEDINIVRGNVLWNCRSEGITAMSDALIENNIVFDADVGINIQTYKESGMSVANYVENLTIRNNTIFRCTTSCLTIPSSAWNSVGTNVNVTGNAAYQTTTSKRAISGTGGSQQVHIAGNIYYGTSQLVRGVAAGNGLNDFQNVAASTQIPNLNFYPVANSPLLNRVDLPVDWPTQDFNGSPRPNDNLADAGAYEYVVPDNPGWVINGEYKPPIDDKNSKIVACNFAQQSNVSVQWQPSAYWSYLEFSPSLLPANWQTVSGPLYTTNVSLALPPGLDQAFLRVRHE